MKTILADANNNNFLLSFPSSFHEQSACKKLDSAPILACADLFQVGGRVIIDDSEYLNASVVDILNAKTNEHLHQEDAFFVADVGEVLRQRERWVRTLPRIEPFYAMKCNPDPIVIKALAAAGVGFDCASKNEIAAALDVGVDPSHIIYANPCKQSSMIRYAAQQKVYRMTFDNAEELYKVKQNFPDAELVLRIVTDDSKSVCQFSTKFGAPLHVTGDLLKLAKSMDMKVIGVSFHVGSGCFDPMSYHAALINARRVFDQALEYGFAFTLLDVGGGFPGNHANRITFEEIAAVLGPSVDSLFPEPHIQVIAEPGRFFVASAYTLAVNVTSRRTVASLKEGDLESFMLYVNDGVYGSFNCILFDHAVCEAKVLRRNGMFTFGQRFDSDQLHCCSIWGPTCDSMDCITKDALLPRVDVGDWLYFDNMGSYTMCAASQFNGFKKSLVIYTKT